MQVYAVFHGNNQRLHLLGFGFIALWFLVLTRMVVAHKLRKRKEKEEAAAKKAEEEAETAAKKEEKAAEAAASSAATNGVGGSNGHGDGAGASGLRNRKAVAEIDGQNQGGE